MCCAAAGLHGLFHAELHQSFLNSTCFALKGLAVCPCMTPRLLSASGVVATACLVAGPRACCIVNTCLPFHNIEHVLKSINWAHTKHRCSEHFMCIAQISKVAEDVYQCCIGGIAQRGGNGITASCCFGDSLQGSSCIAMRHPGSEHTNMHTSLSVSTANMKGLRAIDGIEWIQI